VAIDAPPTAASVDSRRPRGLKELTLLMAALNPLGLLSSKPSKGVLGLALSLAIILFSFFALWRFWQGKQWARVAVFVASVVSVFNLLSRPRLTWPNRIVGLIEAPVGIYLLIWLRRTEVRAFFASKR
jgi:hypothetical protein